MNLYIFFNIYQTAIATFNPNIYIYIYINIYIHTHIHIELLSQSGEASCEMSCGVSRGGRGPHREASKSGRGLPFHGGQHGPYMGRFCNSSMKSKSLAKLISRRRNRYFRKTCRAAAGPRFSSKKSLGLDGSASSRRQDAARPSRRRRVGGGSAAEAWGLRAAHGAPYGSSWRHKRPPRPHIRPS